MHNIMFLFGNDPIGIVFNGSNHDEFNEAAHAKILALLKEGLDAQTTVRCHHEGKEGHVKLMSFNANLEGQRALHTKILATQQMSFEEFQDELAWHVTNGIIDAFNNLQTMSNEIVDMAELIALMRLIG